MTYADDIIITSRNITSTKESFQHFELAATKADLVFNEETTKYRSHREMRE